MKHSLTVGTTYRKILGFAFPLFLGNLFQLFYNMTDAFIVNRTLGVAAFAGVACTVSTVNMVVGFTQGVTGGLTILISQAFGAKDEKGIKNSFALSLIVSLAVGVILTVLSIFNISNILKILGTPEDIFGNALAYLSVIFAGLLITMTFNLFANTLRAIGDSRTPLYFLVGSSIINIVLDLLFIIHFKMGVAGTAYATLISQLVASVLCFIRIRKYFPILSISKENFNLEKEKVKAALKLGIPMGFQNSIISMGVLALQFGANSLGTSAIAAYAIGVKIETVSLEPMRALGTAMTTFVGQNFGAKKYDRVKKGVREATIICLGISILMGGVLILRGNKLAELFLGEGHFEVVELTHQFVAIHAFVYPIVVVLTVIRFSLQGLGRPMVPTLSGFCELAMRFFAAFILIPIFNFTGLAVAAPIAWTAAFIPVILAYRSFLKEYREEIAIAESKNLHEDSESEYPDGIERAEIL